MKRVLVIISLIMIITLTHLVYAVSFINFDRLYPNYIDLFDPLHYYEVNNLTEFNFADMTQDKLFQLFNASDFHTSSYSGRGVIELAEGGVKIHSYSYRAGSLIYSKFSINPGLINYGLVIEAKWKLEPGWTKTVHSFPQLAYPVNFVTGASILKSENYGFTPPLAYIYGGYGDGYTTFRIYGYNGNSWTTVTSTGWHPNDGGRYCTRTIYYPDKIIAQYYDFDCNNLLSQLVYNVPSQYIGKYTYYYYDSKSGAVKRAPRTDLRVIMGVYDDYTKQGIILYSLKIYTLKQETPSEVTPFIMPPQVIEDKNGNIHEIQYPVYTHDIYVINDDNSDYSNIELNITLSKSNVGDQFEWFRRGSVRFYDDYGNELPYWVESWDSNNKVVVVWVKVPELPAHSVYHIIMKSSTKYSDRSDGSGVFKFFDNFNGDDLNTNYWNHDGFAGYGGITNYKVSNGILSIWGDNSWRILQLRLPVEAGTIVDFRVLNSNLNNVHISAITSDNKNRVTVYDWDRDGYIDFQEKINGNYHNYMKMLKYNYKDWHVWTIYRKTGNVLGGMIDYKPIFEFENPSLGNELMYPVMFIYYNKIFSIDWVRVRHYINNVSIVVDKNPTTVYTHTITIHNPSNINVENAEVMIVLNQSNVGNQFVWDRRGSVRFFENGNELPYWVESWDSVKENAVIWIKVPEIQAGESVQIIMKSSPQYSDKSDGSRIFEFFDDFNGNELNSTYWDNDGALGFSPIGSHHIVGAGQLSIWGDGQWRILLLNYPIQNNYIVEYKLMIVMPNHVHNALATTDNKNRINIVDLNMDGLIDFQYRVNNGNLQAKYSLKNYNYNTWMVWGVFKADGGVGGVMYNEKVLTTLSESYWDNLTMYPVIWIYTSNVVHYDWVRVRKYYPFSFGVSIS